MPSPLSRALSFIGKVIDRAEKVEKQCSPHESKVQGKYWLRCLLFPGGFSTERVARFVSASGDRVELLVEESECLPRGHSIVDESGSPIRQAIKVRVIATVGGRSLVSLPSPQHNELRTVTVLTSDLCLRDE